VSVGAEKAVDLERTDEANGVYLLKNCFRRVSNSSSGFSFICFAGMDVSEGKNASRDSRLNSVRLPIFIASSMGRIAPSEMTIVHRAEN
jgi:hypothetical protein